MESLTRGSSLWSERNFIAAQAQHPKRALRMAAWEQIECAGCQHWEPGTYSDSSVKLKLKPLEWGKPGKYGRIICDMSTEASLRAGWLVESVKEAMSKTPLETGNGKCIFVKSPHIGNLGELFALLMSEPTFLYFSDDAVVSVPYIQNGAVKLHFANIDISGCDSSQSGHVFKACLDLVPVTMRPHMEAMIAQCARHAQAGEGQRKLSVQPIEYFEYSGSLLTTTLNNVASSTIGLQILENFPTLSLHACKRELEKRVNSSGWKCTVEHCASVSEVQFLKCSPTVTYDGRVAAFLNFGVILRCIGQKSWDLPGSGCKRARAELFNSALVRGMMHAGNTSLLRTLQRRFSVECAPQYNSDAVKHLDGGTQDELFDPACYQRYGLSAGSYQELLDLISESEFGDLIDCEASRTILRVDYGL